MEGVVLKGLITVVIKLLVLRMPICSVYRASLSIPSQPSIDRATCVWTDSLVLKNVMWLTDLAVAGRRTADAMMASTHGASI